MANPHIILVHGAYHRAWHVGLLKAKLEEATYSVSAVQLPSTSDNPPIEEGFTADAETIRSALEVAATKCDSILPLFHSYAGLPGTEAIGSLDSVTKEKVRRVIYLAAFVPQEGMALDRPGQPPAPWVRSTEDGKFRYCPDPIPTFYHDVEPQLAKEAARHVAQHPVSCFKQAVKHAGWKLYPTTYIFCADDRTLLPPIQQLFFDIMTEEDRKGWEFETIDSSHSPFLAKPEECARLVRKIAGEQL